MSIGKNPATGGTVKLWEPSPEFIEQSNLTRYNKWLEDEHGLCFSDYQALWGWSVSDPADFWESIWNYFNVTSHNPYEKVMSDDGMPRTRWFQGSTLNYAEHIFRQRADNRPALLFCSERQALTDISWEQLEQQTAALQAFFVNSGVKKGDRVAAYVPNIPEATVSLLAALSLGAVWSSCSPDFGTDSVIDRFRQIRPKVLIAVDGYTYNGKAFDRRSVVEAICAALPSVEKVVFIPYLDPAAGLPDIPGITSWPAAVRTPSQSLRFTPVEFGHPVWVLYSSGTTGIPKAITHSHGGMLLEHLKYLTFHNDVKPGEHFFWFTTTGWMMWNFLQASMLAGAVPVLYDGSPGYPGLNRLWELAGEAPVHHFGTSAPYLVACMKAGIPPPGADGLSKLRTIGSTGAPLPPEAFDYVYKRIGKEVWLSSMSGGSDVCTAWVGGNPWLPVYEGEIQCRCLGAAIYAYNDAGEPVQGEVGEMVVTRPMPCMPVKFWGDEDYRRYTESYFEMYPGVWRHGDWLEIRTGDPARGGTNRESESRGLVIHGRSDATLNRQGVRIGTAEIYRVVDKIAEIGDSLIVNIEKPDGSDYMPLFVMMKPGCTLNDSLQERIKKMLRTAYSPRHVPDEIIAVPDIPLTISGKKMEMPVKKILQGKPLEKAVNRGSMKNPESLDFFIKLVGKF